MAGFKVGYFVGSLAATSINRFLAQAVVNLAPPELTMTEIPFKDLPLYSYDYDANSAAAILFLNSVATAGFLVPRLRAQRLAPRCRPRRPAPARRLDRTARASRRSSAP